MAHLGPRRSSIMKQMLRITPSGITGWNEFNATIEGIFTITLHDVYEPSIIKFVDLNSGEFGNDLGGTSTFTMGSPEDDGQELL